MRGRDDADKWARLVSLQKALSLFLSALALGFPFFIFHRYGTSILAVHDKFGHVIGHANYFYLSLGLSALTLFISWASYFAVRKILRPRRAEA